jgi:uncharacterized protein
MSISLHQARQVSLYAQGLAGPRIPGGPAGVLRRLGGVQLDTISVLARSHELVALARLGPIARARIERDYWGPKSSTFEYWSHAACILPLNEWPAFAFQRRQRRAKGRRWHRVENMSELGASVLGRLRAEGPLTARELGGAKRAGAWWDWSETKIAAEWLLDIGDLVCRERRGFQRVYDLAERAIPDDLRQQEWSDEECARHLVQSAGHALGVATIADLGAYKGLTQAQVRRVVGDTDLEPISVEGWATPAFAGPGALDILNRRVKGRTVLLSPFDSLMWFRPRAERLFGIRHRMEAYVPKHKRINGYFAMPILAGPRIVGLVDPGRREGALVAKHVTLGPQSGGQHTRQAQQAMPHAARALGEAARWIGAAQVIVERVDPPDLRPALLIMLSRLRDVEAVDVVKQEAG